MNNNLIERIRKTFPHYDDTQILSMAMRLDLLFFAKICAKEAVHNKTPEFHYEMAKYVQDDAVKRLNIISFRGSAKSTFSAFFLPLWKACTKAKNEPLYILLVSESLDQSLSHLARIKSELTENENIHRYFGNLGEETAIKWQEKDIILANGTRIKAFGSGQKMRGVIHKHTRPTLIILDDVESEKNSKTIESRVDLRKWVSEAVLPTLTPDGKAIMIGTVIAEDCMIKLLQQSESWKTLEYAIVDHNGKPSWEDRYSLQWIEQKKLEMESFHNLSGFYQEYMNMPQSPDDAPFKERWFKYHNYKVIKENNLNYLVRESDDDEYEYEEGSKIPCYLTCGVDLASTLSVKSDFTVFATIAHTLGNKHYVINIQSMKSDPAYHPDRLVEYFLKYKHDSVAIETIAYQETMRASVKRICNERNLYIPGIEKGLKERSSKSERILSLVPLLAQGKFYIKRDMLELVKQFIAYPRASHDDIPDAIWNAMSRAKKPYHKVIIEDTQKKKKKKKLLDWMTL